VYQKGPVQDTSNRRLSFSPRVEFIPECFGTVTESSVASTSEKKRVMKMLLNCVLDDYRAVCQQSVVRNLVGTTLEIANSPSVEDPVENENDIDDDDEVVHS
jgi:hypothetical protein